MQGQEGVPISRVRIRLALGIIVVGLLSLLLWLIFRSPSPKPSSSHSTATKQQQPVGGQSANGGSTGRSGAGSNSSANVGPSRLVNTGAGNVLELVVTTGIAGSLLYQVKLRKRLGH